MKITEQQMKEVLKDVIVDEEGVFLKSLQDYSGEDLATLVERAVMTIGIVSKDKKKPWVLGTMSCTNGSLDAPDVIMLSIRGGHATELKNIVVWMGCVLSHSHPPIKENAKDRAKWNKFQKGLAKGWNKMLKGLATMSFEDDKMIITPVK